MGVTLSTALAFALTSLLIELTLGPNMTYLALVGVQAGRRAGEKRENVSTIVSTRSFRPVAN